MSKYVDCNEELQYPDSYSIWIGGRIPYFAGVPTEESDDIGCNLDLLGHGWSSCGSSGRSSSHTVDEDTVRGYGSIDEGLL